MYLAIALKCDNYLDALDLLVPIARQYKAFARANLINRPSLQFSHITDDMLTIRVAVTNQVDAEAFAFQTLHTLYADSVSMQDHLRTTCPSRNRIELPYSSDFRSPFDAGASFHVEQD